jgi:uncharacterized protein
VAAAPRGGGVVVRVAVIGGGVAGLSAAYALAGRCQVHLFEASPQGGGHSHTVTVEEGGTSFPVDMGFIVFNRRNYPGFSSLIDDLGVATAPSSMGFSVHDPVNGFEYGGERFAGLVARRANVVDGRFWHVLAGVWRLSRAGRAELRSGVQRTLAEFVRASRLSPAFVDLYLLPMAAAIWSMPRQRAADLPAATLLAFFDQHGLLDLVDRPSWETIRGGARSYVEALLARLARRGARLHLGTPVAQVRREVRGVVVATAAGAAARFDHVILAVHSDQALAMLADPTPAERSVLGAIRYRPSDVVLHDDASLLPRRRAAWASWNVRLDDGEGIGVTYLMNHLQPLPTTTPWCVTLNRTDKVDPARIRHRATMAHPQLDMAAVGAQRRWSVVSGRRGIHYCGAYWRHGFHEDGWWSGQRAAAAVLEHAGGARAAGAAAAGAVAPAAGAAVG